MDEKKVREAIEALKIINLKRVHPFYDWEEMREIRDIAIEALEKQLPKKPDIMDYILGDINFKCPTCKSEYICEKGYEHFYCPNCGQKIKWSE